MRGSARLACWCLLLFAAALPSCECLYRCDGTPEQQMVARSASDNRFMLTISGNPHMYVPGEKYAVGIQGTRQSSVPEKFQGFALTVEPSTAAGQKVSVGTFQLYGDALTKFSEKCPHMVQQASNTPRSEVNVHWTAPPPGSGCLTFRATVLETKELWYMHDGLLSRTLCEDIQDNMDEQPDVLEKCCACDEAKYEVTFEGLWSRHTHPKDFPPNGWLTRFSDVIGASHTMDYRFWEYGGIASEGLREVAERGWTRMLESELKAESENIRTIIKARGISYPNVTGKTFAVFRVDKKHHLMSLVSMIVPSPDWIVGVSGLELCLRNCSWVEFKVLNLKPWDVGTDSGMTYTSPDSPTTPREPIRRISSKFPSDPSNPFYDPSGEDMKPLARLYITRQRLYEKSCSDDSLASDDEDSAQSDCAVGEWKPWSHCSVTCGRGLRYRQRFYLHEERAMIAQCNRELTHREVCQAARRCSGEHALPMDPNAVYAMANDPRCDLSDWEDWSSCSENCYKTRSRRYRMKGGMKLCGGLQHAPELQQTIKCTEEECAGGGEPEEENCGIQWTDWTTCSATCGRGIKTRSTVIQGCLTEPKTEQVECDAAMRTCNFSVENTPEMCLQPLDYGACNNRIERWYFDQMSVSCRGFIYRGCKGNANNFLSKEDCMGSCSGLVVGLKLNRTRQLAKYGVKLSAVLAYHVPLANAYGTASPDCDPLKPSEEPPDFRGIAAGSQVMDPTPETDASEREPGAEPIDCKVTRWTRWSPCSVSCGTGTKTKTRHVKIHPRYGGKSCPRLIRTKSCGKTNCGNPSFRRQYHHSTPYTIITTDDIDDNIADSRQQASFESGESLPTWGEAAPPGASGGSLGDCVMGRWSPWSPCSATCGIQASQMRTRNVVVHPSMAGQPCGERVETRSCNLLPCKA